MRVYVGAAVALAVLAAGGWRVLVHREGAERRAMARRRIEDMNSMRWIANLVASSGKLPMKDGVFDPYALVGAGEVRLFKSARFGFGPTEEEARSGDYARFPWQRCRGPRKLGGRPFPLLWEKEPDRDGRMLVARSDGMVAVWDPETLLRAIAEGPVER